MSNVAAARINSFAHDPKQSDSVPLEEQSQSRDSLPIDINKYFDFLKLASDNYDKVIKEIDINGLIPADQLNSMVAEFRDKVAREPRPIRKITMIMGEHTRLRRKYLLEEVD